MPPAASGAGIRLRDIALAVACGLAVPGAVFLGYALLARGADGPAPDTVGLALRIALSIGGLYLSLIAAIHLLIVRRRGVGWRQIGFRSAAVRWYLVAAAILLLWWGGSALIYRIFDLWDHATAFQREALMPHRFGWLLVLPIAIAIGPLAALLEETLFRGLLFQWLRPRLGLGLSAAVSGLLFALVHFNFLVPGGPSGLLMTAEIFAVGVALAAVFEKSGSLWPGIALHAANNLAVLGYLAAT